MLIQEPNVTNNLLDMHLTSQSNVPNILWPLYILLYFHMNGGINFCPNDIFYL